MSILSFAKEFPDEQSCKLKWKAIRELQGVVCPKCGSKEHYWKQDKEAFECKCCGHRQSLKSNTIMHGSQLPFRYWFAAMYLLTSTKKSFSAAEMQRQLGHPYYRPIWAMMQKLRQAMGKRDDRYMLNGTIELDEGFFTVEMSQEHKGEPLKRGRGSQRKCAVLVMAESQAVEPSEQPKGKRAVNRKVGHIKMRVMPNLSAQTLTEATSTHVSPDSTLDTDGSSSYVGLSGVVDELRKHVVPQDMICNLLPWVHIAISNAKRLLLDIFHCVSPEYLQGYLNEFCYKFNRRYFGPHLFDRLLIAGANYKNEFRYRIN